jgi:hypothetical protein
MVRVKRTFKYRRSMFSTVLHSLIKKKFRPLWLVEGFEKAEERHAHAKFLFMPGLDDNGGAGNRQIVRIADKELQVGPMEIGVLFRIERPSHFCFQWRYIIVIALVDPIGEIQEILHQAATADSFDGV